MPEPSFVKHLPADVRDEMRAYLAGAPPPPAPAPVAVPRVYFAQIAYRYGGGYGISTEGARQALAKARRELGLTAADLRRAPQYVLAFPAGTTIQVSDISGGWGASAKPVEVVLAHHLTAEQRAALQAEVLPQAAPR